MFGLEQTNYQPLAERLRPATIDDVIGQQHLLGAGKPYASPSNRVSRIPCYCGGRGVGKTTLARLMAQAFNAEFIALSAVLSGVKTYVMRLSVLSLCVQACSAERYFFVDRVHRFNKSQQDAFLPHVESGLFSFIGATTENPSFEVNSALLSRSAVYVLKSLTEAILSN